MIDYFLKFTDEAAAIAAAPAGFYTPAGPQDVAHPSPGTWNFDKVLPNLKVWRLSQDVITNPIHPQTGEPYTLVTHTYLVGWFAIVSIPNVAAQLMNHSALQFALDREACNEGRPFVLKNNIGGIISDVACSPIFAGCTYPVGGYN